LRYSHTVNKTKIYETTIEVLRRSGIVDTIPIVFNYKPELPETDDCYAEIEGSVRVYRSETDKYGKSHSLVRVFVNGIETYRFLPGEKEDTNDVYFHGVLTKKRELRSTPKTERTIIDYEILVKDYHGRKYYVPCIAWGKSAHMIDELEIGTWIDVIGRFQSRKYGKTLEDGTWETRTAYEISSNYIRADCENGK
jgi:hypothetical protein